MGDFLLCLHLWHEDLHPVVLVAAFDLHIADAHLSDALFQDVGLVAGGVHPLVHGSLYRAVARCDVLAAGVVVNAHPSQLSPVVFPV